MKTIDLKVVGKAMSYSEYWQLTQDLFEQGKTTGPIQNEALLSYTKLNIARMKRLNKTTNIDDKHRKMIHKIQKPITWLVLTEAWCGDAAQIIPVLAKIEELNRNIDLRLILRDEHLDIMDAFLTNGTRSIPKVILLDPEEDHFKVIGSWGPRPGILQKLVMDTKKKLINIEDQEVKKKVWAEVKTEIQKWYAKDKTITIQDEIIESILGVQGVI